MRYPPLIILAAGGTGGHLFPAEAAARALVGRGWRAMLITDARGHAFDIPDVPVCRVSAPRMSGGIGGKLMAVAPLISGITQAGRLMRREGAAAVIGFGGYPSVPTVAAAGLRRLPVILHEQNAVLGRANRLLARFAASFALSFEEVSHVPAGAMTALTGTPVRPSILALRDRAYREPEADGRFNLLVTGGSQGARFFGETIPAALHALDPALRSRIGLTLQVRPEALEETRRAIASLDIEAEIDSFFDDMAERLASAHLLIARAGASTIAEAAIAGVPSLLIPLPGAMDDHQTANARALAAGGGAWVLPQADASAEALAGRSGALMADPPTLARAASAIRGAARPDAADLLIDAVQTVLNAPQGMTREVLA